jgi:hypothetical protein
MGPCCSNDNKTNQDTNLARQTFDVDMNSLAIIIKCQAAFRGLLIRRKIKNMYGFECRTVGMFGRRTNLIEMDPEKLEEQRLKVQELR